MFSRHISRTQSLQENRLIHFEVRVVLKPLVSLIGHFVACSARISVDTQTHRQNEKQTLGELRMRDTANWAIAFTRGLPLVARGESDRG